MKAADLRKSILQAAVQGKLVPQDKNDEPASELLKRIQAEKVALIKDGKLKKEKSLPPITEDEIPYDLPDGWVWCRLGAICEFKNGISKRHSTEGSEQYVLRLADINDYAFDISNGRKIKVTNHDIEEYSLTPNDMGIIRVNGSRSNVGKAILFEGINCICLFCDHLMRMRLFEPSCKNYVRYALNSKLLQDMMDSLIITTAGQNTISQKSLCGIFFPLPPLEEQQRIVSKVDELMTMCDELEVTEKELDTLEEHFFDYLPKSILQAAVQGKLAPQDKKDEPASELLKRIQAEKAMLIKDGKLKKEKPLPPIMEDEILNDLAEGWVWCRIGDIHQVVRGITFPSSAKHTESNDGLVRCATTGSVQREYNDAADVFIPQEYVKRDEQWLRENDIIMSTANSRELVGKTCIWKGNSIRTFGGFLTTLRPVSDINAKYSYYAFKYMQAAGAFCVSSTQTTNIANINNEILKGALYPLPPLAEQQRIVAKVDELMAMCDELKHVAEQPIDNRKIIPFPVAKAAAEPIAMAARGDAENLSAQAKQAIEDLFGEDE